MSAGTPPAGRLAAALALGALAAVPWLTGSFLLFQMTQLVVYAIAILGLNLLTGIGGQISLGHGAFVGIGAYTAAILIEKAGLHYAATLPAAGLVCLGAGFLVGLSARRLDGIRLALATFALAIAMPQILKLSVLAGLTGGVQGITVFSATFETPVPPMLPLPPAVWTYYLALGTGLLLYVLARNIVASRSGRALMAIRDNPVAARAMGIDVGLWKATAFAISAGVTGVAGALGAITVKFVAPDSFTFLLSISLFVGMVIGGVGWLPGCLIGAAAIIFLPNIAEGVSTGLSYAVYGVLLILVIRLAPEGAGGLYHALLRRASGQRRAAQSGKPSGETTP